MALGLNQLRVFDAVVRAGSFARAAERLAVTPPAVSLQIRLLEEACGAALFERVTRRIRLTAAGETLARYSARIFALVTDAEGAVARDQGFAHARLRLVSGAGVAAYYLPPLWTAIVRRYPELQVQIAVGNSARVLEQLVSLEADVGVLGSEHAHPELTVVPLFRDPLVVVVARDHPWARRRRISVRALQGERLILREEGSSGRSILEQRMRSLGMRWRVAMEISSNEVIKRAIELGTGVSVMSRALVRREVEGGYLCAIALREPGFSRTMYLACHRQREDSPLVRAVREVAASLGRAPVDSRVSTWHVTAHSSTDTPRRTPMAKKKTGSSTRSKRRATIGPRDLETRKAGSVQGGFLGGLINKAGKSIRPATKA